MNKRGATGIGMGIQMIVKMLLLSVIALGVFALSAIFYEYHVDVRDAEARILAREMVECLSPNGVLDLDVVSPRDDSGEPGEDNIMIYCGFSNVGRFYVGVDVLDGAGTRVEKLEQGNSGALWVRDLFDKAEGLTGAVIAGDAVRAVDKIVKYDPGYFVFEYPVFVVSEGDRFEGKVKAEVLIQNVD